jgi:hypothetical protein
MVYYSSAVGIAAFLLLLHWQLTIVRFPATLDSEQAHVVDLGSVYSSSQIQKVFRHFVAVTAIPLTIASVLGLMGIRTI